MPRDIWKLVGCLVSSLGTKGSSNCRTGSHIPYQHPSPHAARHPPIGSRCSLPLEAAVLAVGSSGCEMIRGLLRRLPPEGSLMWATYVSLCVLKCGRHPFVFCSRCPAQDWSHAGKHGPGLCSLPVKPDLGKRMCAFQTAFCSLRTVGWRPWPLALVLGPRSPFYLSQAPISLLSVRSSAAVTVTGLVLHFIFQSVKFNALVFGGGNGFSLWL